MDRRAFATAEDWTLGGHRLAVATVVSTWKSSPRKAGSVMLIRDDGLVFGSVSGGCVESAVIAAASDVLASGRHAMLTFGPASPDAVWEIGLSCGGGIRVLVEPCPLSAEAARETWKQAREWTDRRVPYVWEADFSGPFYTYSVRLLDDLDTSLTTRYDEDAATFLDVRSPADRLIVIGGVHIAVPLVAMAKSVGFETVVIEPRAAFARSERFDVAPDLTVCEWPDVALKGLSVDAATYAVALTHDPKIDDPALTALLGSDARYIGVLGSRTTHAERLERLAKNGLSDETLKRLRGPVGLPIGATTPEEIAVSILAEIVQVRRG